MASSLPMTLPDSGQFGQILTEQKNGVLLLSLNNPKKKNALTNEAYLAIVDVLDSAADNAQVFAVVITGVGDYFCSGTDVAASLNPAMADPASAPVGKFMMAVLRFPKLLVAAVNGPAVGIGVTLLPHCDLVYSATSATFWVPFMRLAVVPEFGSSVTFPRILGQAVAGDMLIGSRIIKAEEALQWGLVSELHPCETLLSSVVSKVEAMLQLPYGGKSLVLYKRMLRQWSQQEIEAVVLSELRELGNRYINGETQNAVEMTMAALRSKARSKL